MENSISIGDIAALVTAVGIAVYVMGLAGLSVTIRSNFTSDFTTAWYAVSLLPRTVVAGQGVRLWLMWPIIATVILVPTAQMTNRSSILFLVTTATAVLATLFFSLLWLLFVSKTDEGAVRWLGNLLRERRKVSCLWADARRSSSMSALSFVFVAVASFMILSQLTILEGARLVAQSPSKTTFYGPVLEALGIAVDENSFAIGIVLILLGGFAMGVPSATVVKPPLPRVKLEIIDETLRPTLAMTSGSNSHEDWLVAHSDGFWHLFLAESGELQSIPDEQVRVVRTRGKGHTPPAKEEATSTEEATSEEEAKPDEEKDK